MHLVRLVAALLLAAAAALIGVSPALADPGAAVSSEASTTATPAASTADTSKEAGAPTHEAEGVDGVARVATASITVAAEPPCDTQPELPICNDQGEVDPCEINPDSPDCTEEPPTCEDDPTLPGCTEEPPVPTDPCELDPSLPGCGDEEPPVPTDPCELDSSLPGCTDDDTGGDDTGGNDDDGNNNGGGGNGNGGGNNGGGGNGGGITTGEGQPNTPPTAEGNGGTAVPTGIIPGLVERPVAATLSSCSDPVLCQATEPKIEPVAASTGPTLPATGAGESTPYVLVGGLALILAGAVMLRRGSGLASAPAGKHAAR